MSSSDRLTVVGDDRDTNKIPAYKPIYRREPWWLSRTIYKYAGATVFILLTLMVVLILMHFLKKYLVGDD